MECARALGKFTESCRHQPFDRWVHTCASCVTAYIAFSTPYEARNASTTCTESGAPGMAQRVVEHPVSRLGTTALRCHPVQACLTCV